MYQDLEDGGITVGYEDYNVEQFGGADYEAIYTLDRENAQKLKEKLEKEYNEKTKTNSNLSLKQLIIEIFGNNLEKLSFAKYCDDSKIKYKLNTFIH